MPANAVASVFTVDTQAQNYAQLADTTELDTSSQSSMYGFLDWDAIPGGFVRVGISGLFNVGAQPITFRVKIGGIPPSGGSRNVGTNVLEFTLAANTIHRVGRVGLWVAKPLGTYRRSQVVVTHQTASGTSDLTITHGVVQIQGSGQGQGVMVGHSTQIGTLEGFSLDFDRFEDVTQVVIGWTAQRTDSDTAGVFRLRLGGTWNVADGTVIASANDTGDSPVGGGVRLIESPLVTIAKPTGAQLLKICAESGANPFHYPQIIIREAA